MRRINRFISALGRNETGAAAVEFAIIAWVLILVCIGTVELGRGLYVRNELSYAADHAARMILMSDAFDQELEDAVRSRFLGADDDLVVVFGKETSGAPAISYRTVVLTYPFKLLIPGLSDTISLSVNRRVPLH